MLDHLHRRILYGRQIRISATRLIEMHGIAATAVAGCAARDVELPETERNYWAAVARRTARLSTCVYSPGEGSAASDRTARAPAGGGTAASPAAAACEPVPG
jgi:hypothetical protein